MKFTDKRYSAINIGQAYLTEKSYKVGDFVLLNFFKEKFGIYQILEVDNQSVKNFKNIVLTLSFDRDLFRNRSQFRINSSYCKILTSH